MLPGTFMSLLAVIYVLSVFLNLIHIINSDEPISTLSFKIFVFMPGINTIYTIGKVFLKI